MNGMHGIIFSYEKRNDLRELGEMHPSVDSVAPSAAGIGRWTSPCPIW